ncbi:uncharacterized protein [Rutidosis leptorrhynchoides]|uniref:uncharacterized protein n=1 Tax=Rutidosis leptorrhynchoides TaxID=125765 RepID=UPI003A9933FE
MNNIDYDLEDLTQVTSAYDPQQLKILDFLNAEEEEENQQPIPRNPRRYFHRDRAGRATLLWNDYFSDTPTFPEDKFRRRFRMSRRLFNRISAGILNYSHEPIPSYFKYFYQRRDATGLLGFTIYQKITSAIRQLAYGVAPDIFDEYLHIGETTSYRCLENYCKSVIHLFSTEYLRKPNTHDVQRLITKHEQIHNFPGMLGSLDCIHWAWKNCPVSWKGQYTRGDHGHPTIMLEAVASYDLWIWHAYFEPAGSNNDINMLNQSDLFKELLEDRAPPCNYTVNGKHFTKRYYLADGIYPDWATLVKSFKSTVEPKTTKFKRYQESARKDIEQAFGVLQGRFAVIKSPARQFYIEKIQCIMYTCVILHNMITEDNGRAFCGL